MQKSLELREMKMRSAKQYVGIKSGHLTPASSENKIIIQIIIQNFKITGGINYVISNFNRIKIIK